MRTLIAGLALAALAVAGCGDEASDDDTEMAEAMCSDLDSGMSLMQLHGQAVEHYRGTDRSEDAAQLAAAEIEDLATSEHCPEHREAFEATIAYQDWIAPQD